MLSRVADSIYWMSRYVERVENLARFVEVTLNLMLDLPEGSTEQWQPLVSTTGDGEWFAEKYGEANQLNVLQFLTFDADYPFSIRSSLHRARENARSVRETISSEMWEQLNQFYHMVRDAERNRQVLDAPHEFLHEVRMSSHLFKGITDSSMAHNEGWYFARLGRLLERADKTSRILDVKYYILLPEQPDAGASTDDIQWSALLRSASAFEMYRKRHHGITPSRVVDFLLLDRDFPRAIQYCVRAAESSLRCITGTSADAPGNIAEQRIAALSQELAATGVNEIIAGGLHEFLDALQDKLNGVDDGIYESFVTTRPVDSLVAQ